MMPGRQFSHHTTISAPAFPTPGAAGCCLVPYCQNSAPLAGGFVAPVPAVGVDLCVADASMLKIIGYLRHTG